MVSSISGTPAKEDDDSDDDFFDCNEDFPEPVVTK
jgi:hypothetical protein